jgi:hypothetical protein
MPRARKRVPRKKPREISEALVLCVIAGALGVAGILWWLLHRRPAPLEAGPPPEIEAVRSSISELRDSLQVVVTWVPGRFRRLTLLDTLRVSVVPQSGYPSESQPRAVGSPTGEQRADTVTLPLPPTGPSLTGYSCVAVYHPREPLDQSCTNWQYVRPSARFDSTAPQPSGQLVVRPSGLQVDPDVGGSCGRWQQSHPGQSPWILTNRTAIPDCTGLNLKPTVAKFCAFVLLPDGRRLKTANSINDRYCDELFVEWARERYS